MIPLLSGLNAAQRAAVEHEGAPLLVLSGPGTGKTRVITHRVAYRITQGTPVEGILGLTFTNRAASEMRVRLGEMLGREVPVRIGTFHWAAQALLRRYADRLGIRRDFRLLTGSEARRVLAGVVNRPPTEGARIPTAVSAVKNGSLLRDAAREAGLDARDLESVTARYDAALRAAGALDLDDLLSLSVRLLRSDDAVRARCRRPYRDLLIDEYQDTNPVQQEFVRLMAPESRRVVAVGDEDQAIYAWRQAGSRTAARFLDDFPDAEIIRLEESYRSSKQILRAAGALIAHNPGRLGLHLRTRNPAGDRVTCYVADHEVEEAEWIAAEIAREVEGGTADHQIAVLYRTNAQSRAIEDALMRRGIRYHVHAGRRFYERPEIRAAAAWLRLTLGRDEEAARYLTASVTGIGPARLAVLIDLAAGGPLEETWARPRGVPQRVAEDLVALSSALGEMRSARGEPLAVLVERATARALSFAARGVDQDAARENLGELQSVVREMGRVSLRDLIDRLQLSSEPGGEGVALMTLHAAKGLEFDVVFMAGLEEGVLPHHRSVARSEGVEEERRLCYVGMTRARRRLALSHTHMRFLGGRALLGERSRFVAEMGRNVSLQLSPRRRAKPRLASVHPGERVSHPRWGNGTVVAVEGAGRDTLVTIEFEASTRRRIQLCHAPLTRLESADALAG